MTHGMGNFVRGRGRDGIWSVAPSGVRGPRDARFIVHEELCGVGGPGRGGPRA